jgi:hypothetical protein
LRHPDRPDIRRALSGSLGASRLLDELNPISLAPTSTTLNAKLDLLHRENLSMSSTRNDKRLWDFGSVGKGVAGIGIAGDLTAKAVKRGLAPTDAPAVACAVRSVECHAAVRRPRKVGRR